MVGCGLVGVESLLIFLCLCGSNAMLVVVAGDLWVVVVWW